MKNKTGGPAFSAKHFYLADNEHGMTLRDYFAANAIQGLISLNAIHVAIGNEEITTDDICGSAYEWADAMIKARDA